MIGANRNTFLREEGAAFALTPPKITIFFKPERGTS